MSLFPQIPIFGKAIIVSGLALALFEAVVPHPMPPHVVPFVLAMMGLLYGGTLIATDYLVVVIAVGGAAATDALSHIYFVGAHIDAMLDLLCISLFSSAVSVLATRTIHRLGRSKRDPGRAPEPRPPGE